MLKIQDLHAYYGSIEALKGVNLHVKKGSITCLIGSNGAGKSTLLKSISGMTSRTGSIVVDGRDIMGFTPQKVARYGVTHVPEGRHIFPGLTVYENLEMGACSKESAARKKETVEKIFTWFPKLKERQKQLAGTLSGGVLYSGARR